MHPQASKQACIYLSDMRFPPGFNVVVFFSVVVAVIIRKLEQFLKMPRSNVPIAILHAVVG